LQARGTVDAVYTKSGALIGRAGDEDCSATERHHNTGTPWDYDATTALVGSAQVLSTRRTPLDHRGRRRDSTSAVYECIAGPTTSDPTVAYNLVPVLSSRICLAQVYPSERQQFGLLGDGLTSRCRTATAPARTTSRLPVGHSTRPLRHDL